SVLLPLVGLGVLATVAGFVNAVPLGIHQLEHFLHPEHLLSIAAESAGYVESFSVSYALTGVSLLLALAGAYLGFTWYNESPSRRKEDWGAVTRVLEKKYYMDDLNLAIAGGTLGFSKSLNSFDLEVIDGLVDAVSSVSLGTGDALRRIQSGVVSHYAGIITFGVVALLILVGFIGGWF
ncbi:MAG: NADH-quinone oxidoreductase subunit L, partial [Halobacteria archaeon]|nr:NADH-quinone oxidoreductase subunit L [Halobacteria archaeon]